MEQLLLGKIIGFTALTVLLWARVHHWTKRATAAEAAVERIEAEIELTRIVVEDMIAGQATTRDTINKVSERLGFDVMSMSVKVGIRKTPVADLNAAKAFFKRFSFEELEKVRDKIGGLNSIFMLTIRFYVTDYGVLDATHIELRDIVRNELLLRSFSEQHNVSSSLDDWDKTTKTLFAIQHPEVTL